MGSRTARLVSVQGSTVSPDGNRKHTDYGSFTFESGGRTYRVPFRERLQPRNPTGRPLPTPCLIHGLPGEDARVEFVGGGRKPKLSSLAVDYDLSRYLVDGGALPVPRPERVASAVDEAERGGQPVSVHVEETVATVEVVGVDDVLGWPLSIVRGHDRPLIEDEVLGRKLGYANPRQVRELIDRLEASGALGDVCRTVRQTSLRGGRPASVRLLTRTQALKVVMRSETATADQIQDEIIAVYEAWLDGSQVSVQTRATGTVQATVGSDPWAAIRAIAGGAVELQGRVAQVEGQVSTAARAALDATRVAEEAKTIAEQARTLATTSSVVAEVARATPPGLSGATPDGAWSARIPDGFKSQRALARDFALPSDGTGKHFVGNVARALGIYDDPAAVAIQEVVIGGRARGQHVVYGPAAIDRMAPALRAAHATMVARGYVVRHGAMCPATLGPAKRSKGFVLDEMFEAAVSDRGTPPSIQTSIPGVDDARKAG